MLRLLADENFNADVVRGLALRNPRIAVVRAQDVGLTGEDDPDVLTWAAEHGRIVLTYDRATMPDCAYDRLHRGLTMPGVFVVSQRLSVGQIINELLLVDACTEPAEWAGRVVYLPI